MSSTATFEQVDAYRDADRPRLDVIDQLLQQRFLGLRLIAPDNVRIPGVERVPVIGFRGFRPADVAGFSRAALVVAVRIESGEVFIARPFPEKDRPDGPPRRPPPPSPDEVQDPNRTGCTRFGFDLRQIFPSLPWRAGTYLFTLVAGEQRSNTVRLRVAPEGLPEDSETQHVIASLARPGYPMPVSPLPSPGASFPSYGQASSPPDAPGLKISLEPSRTVIGSRVVVRGSFALPALRRQLVRPLDPRDANHQAPDSPLKWHDVGDARATAVVPITLLFCGRAFTGPWVTQLNVPSYDRIAKTSESERPLVSGQFAVDISALQGVPGDGQGYTVWAISGEGFSEPATLVLLDRGVLPAPGEG